MMHRNAASIQVIQAVRTVSWHADGAITVSMAEVRKMVPRCIPSSFIRNQAQLKGFSVN